MLSRLLLCALFLTTAGAGESGVLSAGNLERLKAATVLVLSGQGSGSGFVHQRVGDGAVLIATNLHVVGTASEVQIVFASGSPCERIAPGVVVAVGEHADLALVRVSGRDLPAALAPAPEQSLSETKPVWVLGFPFGDMLATGRTHPAITVTSGTITSLRRNGKGALDTVQVDADINPGNSGGPVVDGDGRLVGVATAKLSGTGVAMAIPAPALTALTVGRATAAAWKPLVSDTTRSTHRLVVTLSDPLGRITAVSVHLIDRDKMARAIVREEVPFGEGPADGPMATGMRMEACRLGEGGAEATVVFTAGAASTEQAYQLQMQRSDGSVTWTRPARLAISYVVWPPPVAAGAGAADGWIRKPGDAKPVAGARLPTATARDLVGEEFMVGDAAVRKLDLPAGQLAVMPLLSPDGARLHVLEASGRLRQIALPEWREVAQLDLGEAAGAFAQARCGLLVHLPGSGLLLVIEPRTLAVLRQVPLAACSGIGASAGSDLAYCADRDAITVLDASTGRSGRPLTAAGLQLELALRAKRHPEGVAFIDFAMPTLTPDGRSLICVSCGCLHRFRCEGMALVYDEMGPRIGPDAQRLELSDDGGYVALPSASGNCPVGDHPQSKQPATYIYQSADLQKPVAMIVSGPAPRALAFDRPAGRIYTMNQQQQLMLFTPQGVAGKSYRLSAPLDETRFILPCGATTLVITRLAAFAVRLPATQASAPTRTAPPVRITGKPGEPLAASTRRDSQGQSFTDLASPAVAVDLGSDVIGCAADPSGEVLYVIRRDQPAVEVVDPETWKTVAEISVPLAPTAIWTDGEMLAVACPDSKAVAMIDPRQRTMLRTIRCPSRERWYPDTICGRSPDGGLTTVWQKPGGTWQERAIIDLATDGSSRIVAEGGNVHGGAWLPGGGAFLYNGEFPAGTSGILSPGDTPGRSAPRNDALLQALPAFRSEAGPIFATHDQAAIVLPASADGKGGLLRSFLIAPGLDRIVRELPGSALCEVPAQDLIITLDCDPAGRPDERLVVRYFDRRDGRLQRRVRLLGPGQAPRPSWPDRPRPASGALYLPGRELLLLPHDPFARQSLVFTAWRCGPARLPTAAGADTKPANDPPAHGRPGSALRYVPDVPAASGNRGPFRMKRPLAGMAIDAATGAWSWTPTAEQSGTWQVTIIAELDGKDATVISWSLTVE